MVVGGHGDLSYRTECWSCRIEGSYCGFDTMSEAKDWMNLPPYNTIIVCVLYSAMYNL